MTDWCREWPFSILFLSTFLTHESKKAALYCFFSALVIILLSLFSIIIFCFVFADITGKGVSHFFPCIKIAKQKTAFLKKLFFINQQLSRISMLNIVFLQRKCFVEFDLAIFYMQCS